MKKIIAAPVHLFSKGITLLCLLFSLNTYAQNYVVNVSTDVATGTGTSGSLRYCITQANLNPGSHTITFSGVTSITLGSDLPAITKQVTLDGGVAKVTINGDNTGDITRYIIRLSTGSDGSVIKNLNINNTGYEPIHINAATSANVSLLDLTCKNTGGFNYFNYGIYATGNVSGLTIRNFVMRNLQPGYYGIYVAGTSANVNIDSVRMIDGPATSGIGIRFVGAANNIAVTNTLVDLYSTAYLNNGGDYGILFDNTSTNVTMNRDTIRGSDIWGVYLGGAVTNFSMQNSIIDSSHYGDFRGIQCFNTVTGFTLNNVLIDMGIGTGADNGNYGIYFNTTLNNLNINNLTMHNADVFGFQCVGRLTTGSITNSVFDMPKGYGANRMVEFNGDSTINLTMTNVTIDQKNYRTPDDGDYGLRFITNLRNATLTNVNINESDIYGAHIWLSFKDVTWNGGRITKCGRGMHVDNCNYLRSNIHLNNLKIDSSTYYGIRWPACTTTDNVVFTSDTLTNNGYDGLYLDNANVLTKDTVKACVISGNGRTNANGDGIQITAPDNVVITENSISNNAGLGINLTGAANCSYDGKMPVINSVTPLGSNKYTINYTIPATTPGAGTYRVEFFMNSAIAGAEGETYLGLSNDTTIVNPAGGGTYNHTITVVSAPFTSSVTCTYGKTGNTCGTSEFSNAKALNPQGPGCVTNGISAWYQADKITGYANGQNISQWTDQSGNGNLARQFTAANEPAYYATANLMNFNPVVKFDGTSDYMRLVNPLLGTGNIAYSIFTVQRPTSISGGYHYTYVEGNNATSQRVSLGRVDTRLICANYSNDVYETSGSVAAGIPMISFHDHNSSTNIKNIEKNFKAPGLSGTGTSALNKVNSYQYLGNSTGSEYWDGDIVELAVYSNTLSTTEKQKIYSYLSIKWGVSMDTSVTKVAGAGNNYLASDATVMWTANNRYYYRVTGIGRDDCDSLYQKQSRNADTTSLGYATMGLGTIAATNAANTNTFGADKSFLTWADNNRTGTAITNVVTDGTSTITVGGCNSLLRMAKIYMVQKTGAVGAVQVKINMSGVSVGKTAANLFLAINNPGGTNWVGGTAGKLIQASSYSGGVATFDNVVFNGLDSFTVIGQKTQGPANLTSNLKLWLKAEDGIILNGNTVSAWADQGPLANDVLQATAANQPAYNAAANLLNYNPTVQFNGTTAQLLKANGLLGTGIVYTGATVFTVATSNSAAAQQLFRQLTGTNDVNFCTPYSNSILFDAPYAERINIGYTGYATGLAHIALGIKDNTRATTNFVAPADTSQIVYADGRALAAANGATNFTSNNGQFSFGSAGGATFHNGKIGEAIFYSAPLTLTERQKINSYLSVKWGIAMDTAVMKVAGAGNDYIASDGSIIWTANTSYYKRITGIGRDDCSDLMQRQSINQDTTSQGYVTMGLTTIAATNEANPNDFVADKSFLLWADDGVPGKSTNTITGDGTTTLYELACAPFSRMAKTFKVQETGTIGAVQVKVNMRGLLLGKVASDYYLAINSTSSFTGTISKLVQATSYINNVLTFDNVDFSNGQYFTVIGKKVYGPANITSNLKLWLKADDGIDVNGGTTVTYWADQSNSFNDVLQTNSTKQPLYNSSSNLINFNPSLTFASPSALNRTTGVLTNGTVYTGGTIFSVNNSHTPASGQTVFDQVVTGGGSHLDLKAPHGSTYYFDFPYSAGRINVATSAFASSFAQITTGVKDNTRANTDLGGALDTAQILYTNGKAVVAGNAVPTYTGNNGALDIGYGSIDGTYQDGEIGEVIFYSAALTPAERQKIHSYLSVKWGIAVDTGIMKVAAAANNYVASDGTITWTAGSTYYYRITGIGVDSCSDLLQRQSRNQDTTSAGYVTMGLKTITADNASNPNNFGPDKSFEIWADDGVPGIATTTVTGDGSILLTTASCPLFSRLAKTFRVQETGSVDTVQVQVNINGLNLGSSAADFYLAINNTAGFAGTITKLIPATSYNNGVITFDGVNFTNGQFFTVIGREGHAPASITNGLKLWLRPESGITLNGSTVAAWTDQSVLGNTVSQITAANQPDYNDATNLINFNPTLGFDGTRSLTATSVLGAATYSGATAFYVGNQTTASAGYIFREAVGTGTQFNLNATDASGNILWDAPQTSSRLTYATGGINGQSLLWSAYCDPAAASNKQGVLKNGVSVAAGNVAGTYTGNNSALNIGTGFSGNIGELLVYTSPLTYTDRQKIHSYLGIKYGISYGGGDSNYIASDGTVIWNKTTNAGYKNRITGIGRDDCNSLIQRQSRNQEPGSAYVTIGLGAIATTNAANTNNFDTDKNFLVLGDDNGSLAEQATELPAYFAGSKRLGREWKVQVTGASPAIQLQFDLSGITISATSASHLYLMVDTDGDGNFTTGTVTQVVATSLSSGVVTFDNVTLANGNVIAIVSKMTGVLVDVKTMLQGSYNSSTGAMSTALNSSGVLENFALSQPYNTPAFGYSGTESVATGFFAAHPDIVDWILVELRDGANLLTIVARRAAFIRSDGVVVDVDGVSPVRFAGAASGNYYIAVHHRNHLAVVVPTTLALSEVKTTYDFTSGLSQGMDNGMGNQMKLVGAVSVMWSGDYNHDHIIDALDNTFISTEFRIGYIDEYHWGDINMDGSVDALDLTLLNANLLIGANSPLF